MTPERWRQITGVFHAARARDAAVRGAFLDEACAGDSSLRSEVEEMLDADGNAEDLGDSAMSAMEPEPPRLESGRLVGPYRIEALIGSGGMGEVYRARDTRLDRSVAVKVLPLRVAASPGYKQRLEREAKALAALSHPRICPVFDIGQQDGIDYLVMEFVEGETLAKRLTKGALPLPQALRCAAEIADALDKAHAQRIVHRDLKPGNIMLTKTGARLLDFGLATQRPAWPLPPPTSEVTAPTAPVTERSGLMGTLQYMAPEQFAGEPADARSDIFAFGAVLYEMVTGRSAFDGESPAKVVEAILESEPEPVSILAPSSPPALGHLIEACLAKEPDRRWQSAGDLGRYLTGLLGEASARGTGRAVGSSGGDRGLRTAWLPWLAAAGLGLLAVFFGLRWLAHDTAKAPLVHSSVPVPPGALLQHEAGFALSPDGRQLAFRARDRDGVSWLWLRSLDAPQARPLAGTQGALAPFWSPDGRDIGFFADQQLKRIPAAGGMVQVLAGGAVEPKGGTWNHEGRIVYVPHYRTGMFEIPAKGGEARPLTTLDGAAGELSHRWPWFLPDGRSVLFLVQTAEAGAKDDRSRIEVLDPGGVRHEILGGNTSAAYAAGHVLFWRTGSLYSQPFDPERRRLTGEAKPIAPGLDLTWNEWAAFSASDAGTLAYVSVLPWRIEWRERSGRAHAVAAPEGDYAHPVLSPDGGRLAYVAGNTAVRILDLGRGTDTRLTLEGADHDAPAWSPDGEWVAYFANQPQGAGGGIWRRRSSILGEPEMLYSSPAVVRTLSWSPDGRFIAFETSDDILLLDLQSRTVRARISTPAFETEPRFSPDGRWLAYASSESGRLEVYVVPALEGPGKWQVSSSGGFTPRWAPGGRALFFHSPDDKLKVVTMDPGRNRMFGPAEPVFNLPGGKPWRPVYDIAPDGRILVTVQRSQSDSEGFKLILNWPRLLEPPPR